MRLDLCDEEFVAQAGEADIARAIAQGPRNANWSLLLEEDDTFLLAEPVDDGRGLALQCSLGRETLKARAVLDDSKLQALFADFLNRDPQWRNRYDWVAYEEEVQGEATRGGRRVGMPKVEAPAIYGVSFLALLFLTALFPDSWLPGWLPAPLQDTGAWMVVWFVLAIPGVLVAATFVKLREVRKAAGWAQTIGKITRSELVVEQRSGSDQAKRAVNVPAVRYAYQAGGKRHTGDRIGIGEIADNDPRIAEILERYAVGASVPVYYQPDQPANSVLERDAPAELHIIWIIIVGIAVIFGSLAGGLLFPQQFKAGLSALLPDTDHPYLFLFFAVAAALALLRAIVLQWRAKADAAVERSAGYLGGAAALILGYCAWYYGTH